MSSSKWTPTSLIRRTPSPVSSTRFPMRTWSSDSRYVDGRVTVVNWPMGRLLISYFGSRYARVITGMPVRDGTGGFNGWRREVLERVDLRRVQSNGYAFQIELKFRAWRAGFRLREIPILFTERGSGESKMSKRIVREAVWRVWWLRIQDVLGRL